MVEIAALESVLRRTIENEELVETIANFHGKKIGYLTGGGDAPGTNAVLEGLLQVADSEDILVVGIDDGYAGLVESTPKISLFFHHPYNNHVIKGGTLAGSSRTNPEKVPIRDEEGKISKSKDGKPKTEDRTYQVFKNIENLGLYALIALGGNDTLGAANKLYNKGMKIVGVPKSIDFDYGLGYYCIGFQTAVERGVEFIDRIRTTAESHARDFVIEVMGRHAGHITLDVGVASGANVILIPEVQYSMDKVFDILKGNRDNGARYNIIAVSEGAFPEGGDVTILGGKVDSYGNPYLKGIGSMVEKELVARYGDDDMVRSMIIGHIHRAGQPSAFDRIVGYGYGVGAMELILDGKFGKLIGFKDGKYDTFDLETAEIDRRVDVEKRYDSQRYHAKMQVLK